MSSSIRKHHWSSASILHASVFDITAVQALQEYWYTLVYIIIAKIIRYWLAVESGNMMLVCVLRCVRHFFNRRMILSSVTR